MIGLNALATGGEDIARLDCLPWLLSCQHHHRHPFTGAEPGGWGWTANIPGFGLLADQFICFAQLYAMHWILAAVMGTSATGIFAACASIAALASPLLQGVGNYLSPRFVEATSHGSRVEARRLYWRWTLLLTVVVTTFAAIVSLYGRELLWLLYHDERYVGHHGVVDHREQVVSQQTPADREVLL